MIKHEELWQAYWNDPSDGNRNRLIEKYLPLVSKIARRFAKSIERGDDYADYFHDGVFGLMNAIRRYDRSLGVSFPTFASFRVHGAIVDAYRNRNQIRRKTRELPKIRSLHSQWSWDALGKPMTGLDLVEEPRNLMESDPELRDEVEGVLRKLNPRERDILSLYFLEDVPMHEIGKRVGCCESRISQLVRSSLVRLKELYGVPV